MRHLTLFLHFPTTKRESSRAEQSSYHSSRAVLSMVDSGAIIIPDDREARS